MLNFNASPQKKNRVNSGPLYFRLVRVFFFENWAPLAPNVGDKKMTVNECFIAVFATSSDILHDRF